MLTIDDYRKWLQSSLQVGLPAISTDTSARVMAILLEYGNNEGFTHNLKFLAEKDYMTQRFGLHAMGVVDHQFHILLKKYVKELQDYYKVHKKKNKMQSLEELVPSWAPQLLKERYNMKFIG